MGLLPVLCVWGSTEGVIRRAESTAQDTKTSSPPTAVIGAQSRVSRLVPSRTQEQVSELENLLREGLGKGGNGVPGDPWKDGSGCNGKLAQDPQQSDWNWDDQNPFPWVSANASPMGTLVAGCHISRAAGRGWALAVVGDDSPCQGRYRGKCRRLCVADRLPGCFPNLAISPWQFNTSWLCAP